MTFSLNEPPDFAAHPSTGSAVPGRRPPPPGPRGAGTSVGRRVDRHLRTDGVGRRAPRHGQRRTRRHQSCLVRRTVALQITGDDGPVGSGVASVAYHRRQRSRHRRHRCVEPAVDALTARYRRHRHLAVNERDVHVHSHRYRRHQEPRRINGHQHRRRCTGRELHRSRPERLVPGQCHGDLSPIRRWCGPAQQCRHDRDPLHDGAGGHADIVGFHGIQRGLRPARPLHHHRAVQPSRWTSRRPRSRNRAAPTSSGRPGRLRQHVVQRRREPAPRGQ